LFCQFLSSIALRQLAHAFFAQLAHAFFSPLKSAPAGFARREVVYAFVAFSHPAPPA
jgi:hypothetical protein